MGPHPVLDIPFPEHPSVPVPAVLFVPNHASASLAGLDDPVAARRPHAVVRGHERRDSLAVVLVGDADDADLPDAGVLEKAGLDLEGMNVLAAADDCAMVRC